MPNSYTSYLAHKDFFNSRDMCISPALLDFLEQTLEPFNQIKASFENAASTAQTATTPVMSVIQSKFNFHSPIHIIDIDKNIIEGDENYSTDEENEFELRKKDSKYEKISGILTIFLII